MPTSEGLEPTFKIAVKSEYLLKACKDVIQSWPGISWDSDPLEVPILPHSPLPSRFSSPTQLDPKIFITFLHPFTQYRDSLLSKNHLSTQESHILPTVSTLLSTLSTDYHSTLTTITNLTTHHEITFDLLYAILPPRSLIVAHCAITGLPLLFTLQSFTNTLIDGRPAYQLTCESVDLVDRPPGFGKVQTTILLSHFNGTVRIDTLDAYPVQYHADEAGLREEIIRRGRKWVRLVGVHHAQYDGVAAVKHRNKRIRRRVCCCQVFPRTFLKNLMFSSGEGQN